MREVAPDNGKEFNEIMTFFVPVVKGITKMISRKYKLETQSFFFSVMTTIFFAQDLVPLPEQLGPLEAHVRLQRVEDEEEGLAVNYAGLGAQ